MRIMAVANVIFPSGEADPTAFMLLGHCDGRGDGPAIVCVTNQT